MSYHLKNRTSEVHTFITCHGLCPFSSGVWVKAEMLVVFLLSASPPSLEILLESCKGWNICLQCCQVPELWIKRTEIHKTHCYSVQYICTSILPKKRVEADTKKALAEELIPNFKIKHLCVWTWRVMYSSQPWNGEKFDHTLEKNQ